MEKLKLKLTLLKEKENQLKIKIDRHFSSEEEFNSFIEECLKRKNLDTFF